MIKNSTQVQQNARIVDDRQSWVLITTETWWIIDVMKTWRYNNYLICRASTDERQYLRKQLRLADCKQSNNQNHYTRSLFACKENDTFDGSSDILNCYKKSTDLPHFFRDEVLSGYIELATLFEGTI